jgi:hypothetical protein
MAMRLRLALAVAVAVVARSAGAGAVLPDSAYLVRVPDAGPCDVVVDEANAATTLAPGVLNDPAKRVFCVEPGDYRSAGTLLLVTSGTAADRRSLRFHASDGLRNAVQRPERALFQALRIRGSWWVVQGITVQPGSGAAPWFIGIEGGDHNVIDGNLVDGSEHPNQRSEKGILVKDLDGDPATDNAIQRNVVRSGNASRLPVDYSGIAIAASSVTGADNDRNRVLDNEVYDWGDGIALIGGASDCNFPALPHGTVIDGNDVYLTGAKRIDCATGAPDPQGDCACAENGIDVKPDPGPDPAGWTRITTNRLWGFRPTPEPSTCGGSSSNGQAITAGNACPGHLLVAHNIITDSTKGITPSGSSWIIASNLFHDLRSAILTQSNASELEIQFNTIVGVQTAYDDMSTHTDTRCNVVIDNLAFAGQGGPRGTGHETEYNFLYDSPIANFDGGTNQAFTTAAESRSVEFCYWRKRWTGPELVCVPFGATTGSSPHLAVEGACDRHLAARFGIERLRWPGEGGCGLGFELVGLSLLVGRLRRRPGA